MVRRPRTPRRAAVLLLHLLRQRLRCIVFKNMSLIIVILSFFFCCVFRGIVGVHAALKEVSHHAARHHTTQMSAGKVYLAADVLLLPWNAAVMSVGR